MSIDYIQFKSPYTTANRVRRMLWTVCWTLLARPFPKSTFMPWKRFLLRCFGARVASTANVYATARVFMPWNLVMKDYACLASGVDCYNAAVVTIGVNATVSQRSFCVRHHTISVLLIMNRLNGLYVSATGHGWRPRLLSGPA